MTHPVRPRIESPVQARRNPILWAAARGDTVAMIVGGNDAIVRIQRGDAEPIDVPLALGITLSRFDLAAIIIERDVVRVGVAVPDGLQTLTIPLANPQNPTRKLVRARRGAYRIGFVRRIRGGWIVAGHRIARTASRDVTKVIAPVAWSVDDAATHFPRELRMATTGAKGHAFLVGAASADGDAIVIATTAGDGTTSEWAIAIRHGERWSSLGDAFPDRRYPAIPLRLGSWWVVQHASTRHADDRNYVVGMDAIDVATGARRSLDATWATLVSPWTWRFSFPSDVVVLSKDAPTDRRGMYGAIYSANGAIRPLPVPSLEPSDNRRSWKPEHALPIGGHVCLLGDRDGENDGGACVDIATATWRLVAGRAPEGCTRAPSTNPAMEAHLESLVLDVEATSYGLPWPSNVYRADVDSTVVLCTRWSIYFGSSSPWDVGLVGWSLWRVALRPTDRAAP